MVKNESQKPENFFLTDKVFPSLKVELGVREKREAELKAKRDEHIACHNRQLVEKQLYQKEIAEKKKQKEMDIETKTEKCFDLQRKIGGRSI